MSTPSESCKKCGRPVIEVAHHGLTSGQAWILDAAPSPSGQILVLGNRGTALSGELLMQARRLGLHIHTRHGVTCPNPYGK